MGAVYRNQNANAKCTKKKTVNVAQQILCDVKFCALIIGKTAFPHRADILLYMTRLLKEAYAALTRMPEDEQERAARAILDFAAHDHLHGAQERP